MWDTQCGNLRIFLSLTQILREINFEVDRSAKFYILTDLEAVNLDFNDFLHF